MRHPILCADPEGRQGVRTLPENLKTIGFLSNTGPNPLKNHEATKPAFNVGPSSALQRNAYSGIWILSSTEKTLSPSDKTFWIRAWI